jgi:hypothetical protein
MLGVAMQPAVIRVDLIVLFINPYLLGDAHLNIRKSLPALLSIKESK